MMLELKSNLWAVGLLFTGTLIFLKIISTLLTPKSMKRLPPLAPTTPIIGAVARYIKDPVGLMSEYSKYGSVFTMKMLTVKVTFLVGPDVSSHFFTAPQWSLSQKEVYKFIRLAFGPRVLFAADRPGQFEEHKRFIVDGLKTVKLRSYADSIIYETERFFSRWSESGTVDLKKQLQDVMKFAVVRCVFGREIRENFMDDLNAILDDILNSVYPSRIFLRSLPIPIPTHLKSNQAHSKLEQIVSTVIKSCKKSDQSEDDMLQTLIESNYKDGQPLTVEEISGLLIAVMFGAHYAASIVSTWTGAYMLQYKKFLSAAVEEQKDLIKQQQSGNSNTMNFDSLFEMDVLHRNIKESLRLQTPLIMMLRTSHEDFTVKTSDGKVYDIPKGHVIGSPITVANKISSIYKEPDSYDLDRFAPGERKTKLQEPTLICHLEPGSMDALVKILST